MFCLSKFTVSAKHCLFCLFLFLAAFSQASVAAASEDDPFSSLSLEIPSTQFVLKNGLTVVVNEDHSAPKISVNVSYHVGSKNEVPGRTGFAHLFEHLMFNGSAHLNEDFFKPLQKIGATETNGSTDMDRTRYYETVSKEALDTVLWMESDRMGHLLGAVDQAKLDEQRAVVKNEKRSYENQPYSVAEERIIRATSPVGHPYDHTVIGSMSDLDAATLEDVHVWFQTYYGPSNAVLVLSGDITVEDAKKKAEAFFGSIPPGPPVAQPRSWPILSPGMIRDQAKDHVAQPMLILAWHAPGFAAPAADYLQIICNYLTENRSSPLMKRLVIDEQLATSVEAELDARELSSLLLVKVMLKPDSDMALVENIVFEELHRVRKEGIPREEIRRLRAGVLTSLAKIAESTSRKADMLAQSYLFLGAADGWRASYERVKNLSESSDIKIWLAHVLASRPYSLHILPSGELEASREDVDRTVLPEPALLSAAKFPSLQRATLSNGLELVVVPRPGVPLVNVMLSVGKQLTEDFADSPSATSSIVSAMLLAGTKKRTASQLNDAYRDIGTQLSVSDGEKGISLSFSVLKSVLPRAVSLLSDVVQNPVFPADELARIIEVTKLKVQAARKDPSDVSFFVTLQALFGPDSPYGRQVPSPGDVGEVRETHLKTFHQRWFRPNNALILLSGDIQLEEVLPEIEGAFAGWSRADLPKVLQPWSPSVCAEKENIIYLIDKPDAPQSIVRVSLVAPPSREGDEVGRMVFNDIFGGAFMSRLNMKIREEKGWSYGAYSSFQAGIDDMRIFTIQAPVQTDKTAETVSEVLSLFQGVTSAAGGALPTQGELSDAKVHLSQAVASSWYSPMAVLGCFVDQVRSKLSDDFCATLFEKIKDASLDQVHLAGSMLAAAPMVTVVVGDRSKIEPALLELNIGAVQVLEEPFDYCPRSGVLPLASEQKQAFPN